MSTIEKNVDPPHFHAEEENERFLWICDRDQGVALFDRHELHFELLHGTVQSAPVKYSLPRHYHASMLRGARLTASWWLDRRFTHSSQRQQLTISNENSSRWKFRFDEIYCDEDEGTGYHEYSLMLDGQHYVVECAAQLQLKRSCPAEFANFLAFGVGEAWANRKHFTHTVWCHPDGRLLCLPHNPLHPILPGAKNSQRHVGGFLGFFAASTPAWIVEIVSASPGVKSVTCDNAYDEHLQCLPATADEQGFYRYDIRYRLRQLPTQQSNEFLKQAQFIEPFPHGEECKLQWRIPAMVPGNSNGRASPVVTVGEPFTGVCWPIENGAWEQKGATVDSKVLRSAKHTLRLKNDEAHDKLTVTPAGPSIHLDSNKRYRLEAVLKVEGDIESQAYLSAQQIFYNLSVVERCDESQHIVSTTDWTRISTEITPVPDDPYVVIAIHLDGKGTAWFDEISLKEIDGATICLEVADEETKEERINLSGVL